MPIIIFLIGIAAGAVLTTLKFDCPHGPLFLRGLCLH